MHRALKWKLLIVILIAGFCVWKFYPPFDIHDKEGRLVQKGKINLGLDLQGGMHLVLKVDTSKLSEKEAEGAPERALEIIRNRIDQLGVRELSIQRQGRDEIVVQLPGITERGRALDLIGKTALLEFKLVSQDAQNIKAALEGNVPAGYELKRLDEEPLLLESEPVLTGSALVDARVSFDQSRFNEPYISFRLNDKGAKIFAKVTRENIERRLAIVLDGVPKSAPVIKSEIPMGEGQITGRFTPQEANDLAIVLRAGALPAPVYVEEERTVGPLLGQDSIRAGIRATVIGAILVLIFMAAYYLVAGLIADIALVLNFLIMMAALSLFHATLTLPGIAGVILSLGMAVDANVLIYERMREELQVGKTLRAAISAGYNKAFSAILDSNLTTLIAAALLFQFGSGPIRGFAVTLTIGIGASMFTAIIVTRLIFDMLSLNKNFTTLKMLKFIPETKFDFIGKRKICYIISAIIIISGLVVFSARGARNYGVDFTGGTLQEFQFEKPIQIDKIRTTLKDIGLGNASIQQLAGDRDVLIRTYEDTFDKIDGKFKETFADNKYQVLRIEKVGPAVGQVLRKNAIWTLLLGLLGILVYVWIRFDLKYAIAGVVGLFHDVFIAIGALALAHREFDLTIVAALLTIAGYSINDTVVIYDRIRENVRSIAARKLGFADIINLSVNQTLARTALTNLTVFLTVFALFFLGGEVLNAFSFCLIAGFISGVYSTVYISTALLLAWRKKIQR